MVNGKIEVTGLCLAVLMLLGVASAQEVQFDLILERTFDSRMGGVGIDYDTQGRPVFTIALDDRVELMDSQGNTKAIVSGLREWEGAGPSENGRFVVVLQEYPAWDILTRQWYPKYDFTLKRRNGETVYEIADCPFNDFRMGNDGSVCGTWILDIDPVADWLYYDPAGNLTKRFPASSAVTLFGDSGSYLLGHGDSVSAYTGSHTLLWSIDLSSAVIGWGTSEISSDGRYFVRYGEKLAAFYRDGELVKVDSAVAGWWHPGVTVTPDNRHALLVKAHRAYLWDLGENAVVRSYDPPAASASFDGVACSSDGKWVLFCTFTRDASTSAQYLISLYDENAQIVWQTEGPSEDMMISGARWLTIDPTATYISQRSRTKLWLYKRR